MEAVTWAIEQIPDGQVSLATDPRTYPFVAHGRAADRGEGSEDFRFSSVAFVFRTVRKYVRRKET